MIINCRFPSQNIARSAVFDVMQRNSSDNSDEIGGNVAGGEDGSGVALETGFDHEQGRYSVMHVSNFKLQTSDL